VYNKRPQHLKARNPSFAWAIQPFAALAIYALRPFVFGRLISATSRLPFGFFCLRDLDLLAY
jgi:hypothetical protein